MATVLASIDAHPLRAAFVLACTTGARRGEICGLRISDVQLDESVSTFAGPGPRWGARSSRAFPKLRRHVASATCG